MSESLKLLGKSKHPVKYPSLPTRFATMHGYMGGAEINETQDGLIIIPGEEHENLEHRFNSGVNRIDMPKMWGYPNPTRKLANKTFSLSADVAGWRRDKGEPL